MFDIFTEPAKRAIMIGQDEAVALGHDFMGTEHLLLGLAGVGEGLAGQVLADHGITADRVRADAVRMLAAAGITATHGKPDAAALATIGIDVGEIRQRADAAFGAGEFVFPRPAYTPEAKTAIEQAVAQAQGLGRDYIGSEHMLLGVIHDGTCVAARVLGGLGVDLAELRQAVLARESSQSAAE